MKKGLNGMVSVRSNKSLVKSKKRKKASLPAFSRAGQPFNFLIKNGKKCFTHSFAALFA